MELPTLFNGANSGKLRASDMFTVTFGMLPLFFSFLHEGVIEIDTSVTMNRKRGIKLLLEAVFNIFETNSFFLK